MVVVALIARFGPFSGDEAVALVLGGSMCVFFVVSEPILSALQAIEKMRYLVYATTLSSTVISIGSIALVTLGVRADGLLLASVAMTAVVAFLSLVWVREHFRIDWRVRFSDLRALLVDSLPYWSGAAFFTLYLWIDSVMLGIMTPSNVLGWYGLPTRLFGALMVVPVILTTAWLPQLTHAFRQGTDALNRAARNPIELVLILSLPVCVGTVLISGPLVRALYGPGFAGSIPVLAILALCVPPMYLNIMANQVMIARKRQMTWTKVMVLASVINPALNLVLIPYFQRSQGNGAIGASVAMVITEVILAGVGVVLVREAFVPALTVRVLKGAAATAGMAIAVILALRMGLVVGILAGVVSFPLLALMIGVLNEEQRGQLRTAVGRIRRGGRAA
jgi:PST family polysaccharide transporter